MLSNCRIRNRTYNTRPYNTDKNPEGKGDTGPYYTVTVALDGLDR